MVNYQIPAGISRFQPDNRKKTGVVVEVSVSDSTWNKPVPCGRHMIACLSPEATRIHFLHSVQREHNFAVSPSIVIWKYLN